MSKVRKRIDRQCYACKCLNFKEGNPSCSSYFGSGHDVYSCKPCSGYMSIFSSSTACLQDTGEVDDTYAIYDEERNAEIREHMYSLKGWLKDAGFRVRIVTPKWYESYLVVYKDEPYESFYEKLKQFRELAGWSTRWILKDTLEDDPWDED